jgi:very-short-patch-repair endonuclease
VEVAQVLAEVSVSSQGLATTRALQHAGVARSRITRAVAAGVVLRVCAHVYALSALAALPRFVVTDDGVSPEYVAHARAALLSLGDSATACRRTAAALYGWGLLVEPGRSLDIAVPHGRSRVALPLVRPVQRRALAREPRVVLSGTAPVWITTPVQTVMDCALSLPLLQAVVVCDSALRAGDVSVEELQRAAARLPGVRDARKVRRVVELCDPGSGSVLESVLRVRMLLVGITDFTSQLLVRDVPGQQVRVDFGFLAQGVVVEVDGVRWHQHPARDQARDNVLAALGWRVLRFTWAQVVHEPEAVLAEIAAARACATPSFHLVDGLGEEAA